RTCQQKPCRPPRADARRVDQQRLVLSPGSFSTSVREPDRERAHLITNLRSTISPSPRLRGEGRGEGDWRQARIRGEPPHPDRKNDPTSSRKRGQVTELAHLEHIHYFGRYSLV